METEKKESGLKLPGGNLLKILKIFEESGKIKILMKILQDLNKNLTKSYQKKSVCNLLEILKDLDKKLVIS